ncbi:MAG: AraC family transcriptional regulator [Hyphomonadaceae bacterium]|nr:AraC family transcriptional regulator [Hyphomonadaceae bacterium]
MKTPRETFAPQLRQTLFTDFPGYLAASRRAGIQLDAAYGLDAGWKAPLMAWTAPKGFDAPTTRDSHYSIIFFRYTTPEAMVRRIDGRHRARSARPLDQSVTLQYPGVDDHYNSPRACDFSHLFLPKSFVDDIAEHGMDKPARIREDIVFHQDPRFLRLALAYAQRAQDRRDPPSAIEMDAHATLLCIEMLKRYDAAPRMSAATGALVASRMRRLTEFTHAHLGERLTLEDLANAAGLSLYHFCRSFKRTVGITPHRWLMRLRIERARTLLLNPHIAIADVADEVGFQDPSHFARAFRAETGYGPRDYRRREDR